jgi:hypothetical protein
MNTVAFVFYLLHSIGVDIMYTAIHRCQLGAFEDKSDDNTSIYLMIT